MVKYKEYIQFLLLALLAIISFLIIATAFSFSSCKSEVKKTVVEETKVKEVKKSTAAKTKKSLSFYEWLHNLGIG